MCAKQKAAASAATNLRAGLPQLNSKTESERRYLPVVDAGREFINRPSAYADSRMKTRQRRRRGPEWTSYEIGRLNEAGSAPKVDSIAATRNARAPCAPLSADA